MGIGRTAGSRVQPTELVPLRACSLQRRVRLRADAGLASAATHQDALDDWIDVRPRLERVCCRSREQLDDAGANLRRYREAFGASSVRHVPVPDHRLIAQDRLHDDILPFLVDACETEERVVVHCLAGIGRTGQVLAAWRCIITTTAPTTPSRPCRRWVVTPRRYRSGERD